MKLSMKHQVLLLGILFLLGSCADTTMALTKQEIKEMYQKYKEKKAQGETPAEPDPGDSGEEPSEDEKTEESSSESSESPEPGEESTGQINITPSEGGTSSETGTETTTSGSTASNSSESSGSSAGSSQPTTGTAEPASSDDTQTKVAAPEPDDPTDKRYCEGHMKLARRHFKSNDLQRSGEEASLVIERYSLHAEARFLKAVISAKQKKYVEAWRNIEVAQKTDENNPRIKDFIARLEKAMPKPSELPEETTVTARPDPKHSSALLANAFEAVFADKALAGKVETVSCNDPVEVAGKVNITVVFTGIEKLDPKVLETKLRDVGKVETTNPQIASEGKQVTFTAVFTGLPIDNPEAKPVEKLSELLREAGEECDIKINKSQESDPDADKIQTGTYSIVARSWTQINDFLQKLDQHATWYIGIGIGPTSMNQQSVWKGDLKIRFKVQ